MTDYSHEWVKILFFLREMATFVHTGIKQIRAKPSSFSPIRLHYYIYPVEIRTTMMYILLIVSAPVHLLKKN